MSMEPEVLAEWTAPLLVGVGQYRVTKRVDEYGQDVYALERFNDAPGYSATAAEWQVIDPSNPHHAITLIRRVIDLSSMVARRLVQAASKLPHGD